jgi:hypothetical protein
MLWQGKAAQVPAAFGRPPERADMVRPLAGEAGAARLRSLCQDRRGALEHFPAALRRVAAVARAWGDDPSLPPWRADETLAPVEAARFVRAQSSWGWASRLVGRSGTCFSLGLTPERCARCADSGAERDGGADRYDCQLRVALRAHWRRQDVFAAAAALSLALVLVGAAWGSRLLRARRRFGAWLADSRRTLGRAGVAAAPRRLRLLFPRLWRTLLVRLPATPDWERWGPRAVLVRAERETLSARDVDEAAAQARSEGLSLALLAHGEDASPELGAARAMLDWAGERRAGGAGAARVDGPAGLGAQPGRPLGSGGADLAARQPLRGARAHHLGEPVLRPRAAGLGAARRGAVRRLDPGDRPAAHGQVLGGAGGGAPAQRALGLRGLRRLPPRDGLRRARRGGHRGAALPVPAPVRERARAPGAQVPPPGDGELDSSRLAGWFASFGRSCQEATRQPAATRWSSSTSWSRPSASARSGSSAPWT